MKSHSRRPRAAAAVTIALAGGLVLGGCGQVDPRAAARVGDRVVAESDVEAVLADFRRAQVPADGAPERSKIAQALVVGPIFFRHLQGSQVIAPAAQVRRDLERQLPDVSAQTVDYFRMSGLSRSLGELEQHAQVNPKAKAQMAKVQVGLQQAEAEIRKKVESGELALNPRYAQDQPGSPNWIETPQEGPDPFSGGAPGAPDAPQGPPAPQG